MQALQQAVKDAGGTVDVMAQWVRKPQKAVRMEDLGTLTLRYAANEPKRLFTMRGRDHDEFITNECFADLNAFLKETDGALARVD